MKKGFLIILILLLSAADSFACTTVIVSAKASATGRPLLWKQRDTPNEFNVMDHRIGRLYSFTAIFNSNDLRRENAYCGANDRGFAIVNNLSYNLRPDSLGLVTVAGKLMTEALGECVTVGDFENLILYKGKPNGLSTNFGVIDAFGGAAYFEVWDYGWKRYDVTEGYMCRTNYSFSGRQGKGRGYARYMTADYLLSRQVNKGIGPEWLLEHLGRSFFNVLTGEDRLKSVPRDGRMALDIDYIPRTTTVSSVVIEGVGEGEAHDVSVLWTAIGYTPCSYAVPVWVAAKDEMPSFVRASSNGNASACELANCLKHRVHPFAFESGESYIDIRLLSKDILPLVRKAEKTEFSISLGLDRSFRRDGFDKALVESYDALAEERFLSFQNKVKAYE